ncbi:hypothetical protein ACPPVO_31525 [Dactylosporangium sp. McL0621]|uniref:hypothetical protein n=1 Tax=Dactylosporangium sp. McL0621 TaxID=3415678 RepID=UPI003CE7EED6
MRLLTVAAGVAVGYVLGTRAGREKYEQIVASTGRLRENPTAGQAVQTVQELFKSPTPPLPAATATVEPGTPAPKPRKRTAAKETAKPDFESTV